MRPYLRAANVTWLRSYLSQRWLNEMNFDDLDFEEELQALVRRHPAERVRPEVRMRWASPQVLEQRLSKAVVLSKHPASPVVRATRRSIATNLYLKYCFDVVALTGRM